MGRHRLFLLCIVLLLAAAPAAAQPFNWLLPAGGETWTAGTTHTVEWSGGPASNVDLLLISLSPYQVWGPIAINVPNSGAYSWPIPANVPPGPYQVYVGDTGTPTVWAYSQSITIQAAPTCGANCVLTSVAMPFFDPPAGVCGQTQAEASGFATAWAQSNFACPNGYTLDQGSMVIDVTFLPVGVCLAGYSGPFVAEASAVACCCADPAPVPRSTWGRVKSRYR